MFDKAWRNRIGNIAGVLGWLMIMVGFLYSRALLSIGMIVLAVYACFFSDFRENLRIFLKDKLLIGLTLIFFIYLISGLNSSNHEYLLERLRIKFPFLILPFSIVAFRNKLSTRNFNLILMSYFICLLASGIYVMSNYSMYFNETTEAYSRGAVMLTPITHLNYSLLLSLSIFIGIHFITTNTFEKKWIQWILIASTLFLIILLHLLAVRTGLISFYLGIFYLIGRFMIAKRKFLPASFSLIVLVSLPVISYFLFPSMQGRMSYMNYDLNEFLHGNDAQHLSDASRIISLQIGWDLAKENWLTGVGIGDLLDEMTKRLQANPQHPATNLLPLNQFLLMFTATGVFGCIIFTIVVFLPFFYRINRSDALTMVFLIISIFALFTNDLLEEQIGVAFYIVFLLLFYQFNKSSDALHLSSDTHL